MQHHEGTLADCPTIVKEIQAGSLAGVGSVLEARPYHVTGVDVSHHLAKKDEVQFIFGKGITLVPDVIVMFPVKVLATLVLAATPLR
jgi:hypothetical protein